jgi:putative component of toxin-antitoxin plasmid stabilization module
LFNAANEIVRILTSIGKEDQIRGSTFHRYLYRLCENFVGDYKPVMEESKEFDRILMGDGYLWGFQPKIWFVQICRAKYREQKKKGINFKLFSKPNWKASASYIISQPEEEILSVQKISSQNSVRKMKVHLLREKA